MRKVTKILGKVLSAAVLLLIVLPLALSLLLSINAVQNFVVDRAAQFASRKLETVVRIDRVDIGIFDRITLEGLYVEDYGGDTLLYVGKLHAFITQFGIFSNGFTLRHGRLTDGKFYLREMPDGVMNVKQIVSRMGRKEKKEESDFRLSISALTVENLEFRLEKLQHRNPVYGIDFSDMDIRDIDAVIDNFTSYSNGVIQYITSEAGALHYSFSAAMTWIYFLVICLVLLLVVGLVSKKVFYMND